MADARRRRPDAPKKRFGQHFLEPVWADRVVRSIDPVPGESFLEIGPGRGVLTRRLAAAGGRVAAVEIDRDLAAALESEGVAGVSVLQADFLGLDSPALDAFMTSSGLTRPVRVAGNLPYNVAAPIVFRLLEHWRHGLGLRDATVMVQREVADRLTAVPGTRDYGVLTVLVGYRAGVSRLLELPPGAFRPPPKVRSSVVRLSFHPPSPAPSDEKAFEQVVKGVFSRRRKMLSNALKAVEPDAGDLAWLVERAGLDANRRPETLSIAELARLTDAWVAGVRPRLPPSRPPVL